MSVLIIILAVIGGFSLLPVVLGLIGILSVPILLVIGFIGVPLFLGMMLGGKFQITIKRTKKEEDDKD